MYNLVKMNCPHCVLSLMAQHPELLFWLKCPICGFSAIDKDKLSKYPNIDKMAPRDLIKALNMLVAPLQEDDLSPKVET